MLLASTPNDGSQAVLLPEASSSTACLRIEPIGNVFFDVNDANFTIVPGAPVVTTTLGARRRRRSTPTRRPTRSR